MTSGVVGEDSAVDVVGHPIRPGDMVVCSVVTGVVVVYSVERSVARAGVPAKMVVRLCEPGCSDPVCHCDADWCLVVATEDMAAGPVGGFLPVTGAVGDVGDLGFGNGDVVVCWAGAATVVAVVENLGDRYMPGGVCRGRVLVALPSRFDRHGSLVSPGDVVDLDYRRDDVTILSGV